MSLSSGVFSEKLGYPFPLGLSQRNRDVPFVLGFLREIEISFSKSGVFTEKLRCPSHLGVFSEKSGCPSHLGFSLREIEMSLSSGVFLREIRMSLSSGVFIPRQSRRDIVLASSLRPSIPSVLPSALFVCPEPYLSTYWSDLMHS